MYNNHNNDKSSTNKIKKIGLIAIIICLILIIIVLAIKGYSNNKKGNNDTDTTIVINQKKLTLGVGKKTNLNAYVLNVNEKNPVIIWKSDNPEIVEITTDGIITAKKEGSTTIRASYGSIQTECSVTVTSKLSEIQSLKIISGNIMLKKGEGTLLQIEILPEEAKEEISFTSADNSIATVNEKGYVNGINSGTTTITVKTASGLSDSITVTVTEKVEIINPTSVKIYGLSQELIVGGTANVLYDVLPTNATNKNVTWSSSDPSIASISSNGVITGHKTGTCVITISTYNNIKDKYTVIVKNISGDSNKDNNMTDPTLTIYTSPWASQSSTSKVYIVAKSDVGLVKFKYCRFKSNSNQNECIPDTEIVINNITTYSYNLSFTDVTPNDIFCGIVYDKNGNYSNKECIPIMSRAALGN